MTAADRTDHRIVGLLQENARRSNKELAAAADIAPSTCSERVKRLEQDGVFRGFHAAVDPEWLGIGVAAMVAIRLRRHGSDEVGRFWEHMLAMPEVIAVSHVSGVNDFLVHVVVRDTDHLRELAVQGFNTLPEVGHIETSLIFEHVSKPTLPDYRSDGR